MLGLTVQNFVSAATGIAVLAALIRGIVRRQSPGIGNFWADLTRSTLYILVPLSLVLALLLVGQGAASQVADAGHESAEGDAQTDQRRHGRKRPVNGRGP